MNRMNLPFEYFEGLFRRLRYDNLWSAVKKTLVPPYKATAMNFIADGDYVVMEASGENATPDGKIYNNKYCWVCRITDGKLHELREYMDTQLVTDTFLSGSK